MRIPKAESVLPWFTALVSQNGILASVLWLLVLIMNRPFTILEEWVKQGRIHLLLNRFDVHQPRWSPQWEPPISDGILPAGLSDKELFEFAMKDVKSLGWSAVPLHNRPPTEIQAQDDEQDALRALEEFVRKGMWRSSRRRNTSKARSTRRAASIWRILRSGRFSVQAYVDLHGLNLQEARFVLEEFLLESVRAGFTCVRVIHGRGRHSHKHHPVLKENIQRWLCTRRMSRHVIAYTSARRCDGGGGAVYVLLAEVNPVGRSAKRRQKVRPRAEVCGPALA